MYRFSAIFLLCFVLVSVNSQWTDSTWNDSLESGGFGGIFHICIDGVVVNGAYSQYGIIQGTVSNGGTVISGSFYEGGAGELSCVTGTYSLTIDSTGNEFSGTYTCVDDDETYNWSESRIGGASSVSDEKCAVLGSLTIGGLFSNGDDYEIAICMDDDEYSSSYSYSNNIDGFEDGVLYLDGKIGSGVYYEENGNLGISLLFTYANGEIGNFYWQTDDDGDIDTVLDYNSLHSYDILERIGSPTNSECLKNDDLNVDGFSDIFIDEYETSSAWMITVSVFSLLIIALAF